MLIFLLVKFAWKPILNSLNEREEGIKNALESAEEAKKEKFVIQCPTPLEKKVTKEIRKMEL